MCEEAYHEILCFLCAFHFFLHFGSKIKKKHFVSLNNKTLKHWSPSVQSVIWKYIISISWHPPGSILLVRVGCLVGSFRHKVFFLDCTGEIFRKGSFSSCIMLGIVRTRCSVGRWMSGWTGSLRIWCPHGLSLCCLTVWKPYDGEARIEACVILHSLTVCLS